MNTEHVPTRRVLIIDDYPSIHEDFRKILATPEDCNIELASAERALFGQSAARGARPSFELDYSLQGQDGLVKVDQALAECRPYAMAFVDMRMPPGWDGLETIGGLWAIDPNLQVAICSAHSDYDWTEVIALLGYSDKLLIIKKPFEIIEVLQCACALTRKWDNERILRRRVQALEQAVSTRTEGLDVANKQLRRMAPHDALTGPPNRVLFEDRE
jgi:DNA-binding LytR/AlgR family response regulator